MALEERDQSVQREASKDGGGIEIALSALVFGLAGFWLDNKLGTVPVFFIAGFLFGFIGSSLSAYYRFKYQMAKHDEADEKARHVIDLTKEDGVLPSPSSRNSGKEYPVSSLVGMDPWVKPKDDVVAVEGDMAFNESDSRSRVHTFGVPQDDGVVGRSQDDGAVGRSQDEALNAGGSDVK